MNDDGYYEWWSALDSEAEEWEAQFQLRKATPNGLPITPDTANAQTAQEKAA